MAASEATAGPGEPLLAVRDLVHEFVVRGHGGVKNGVVHAVSGVSLEVRDGETLGVVGESGSGKSTLVRSILQAPRPLSGEVVFRGVDLTRLRGRRLHVSRRHMQAVYQDPFGSLDPKWTVFSIVEEPLGAHGIGTRRERRERTAEVLDLVGLDPGLYGKRKPRQLSGGQCQRVAIARSLVMSPSLVLCDEAVSSLDVLSQAQVLNLFEKLRAELSLSYLFVAHDLALVKQVSDRVAVMYMGRLCEVGPSEALYAQPLHPYTAALLDSIPSPEPTDRHLRRRRTRVRGEVPSPLDPPSGCRFRTRCPRAERVCAEETPQLRPIGREHRVACHFPLSDEVGWGSAGVAVVNPGAASPASLPRR
ncbi:dipeptide ABC transporter ATP-binding protein [Pseudonocardia yunnanensis]|uniref:ABC transporter ATP-binding protein n=1 Tax=Pseudonocardia yunnanensis TaxID=58107 RepID=A0ABW4F7F4_9PSEU